MNIPNYENSPIVGSGGYLADQWSLLLQQLLSQLQQGVGTEGFQISSVTAAQLALIQGTFVALSPTGVQPGTLVFNKDEVNGGTMMAPNGQLFILLNDGTFHAVTNM